MIFPPLGRSPSAVVLKVNVAKAFALFGALFGVDENATIET